MAMVSILVELDIVRVDGLISSAHAGKLMLVVYVGKWLGLASWLTGLTGIPVPPIGPFPIDVSTRGNTRGLSEVILTLKGPEYTCTYLYLFHYPDLLSNSTCIHPTFETSFMQHFNAL